MSVLTRIFHSDDLTSRHQHLWYILIIIYMSNEFDCPSAKLFNILRPKQNGRHFADDTFKPIFLNENMWISIKISLNVVSKGPIHNIAALVEIMAWRRSGDKPLSEPTVVRLLTHIYVTRPQWVNIRYRPAWSWPYDSILQSPTLVRVIYLISYQSI